MDAPPPGGQQNPSGQAANSQSPQQPRQTQQSTRDSNPAARNIAPLPQSRQRSASTSHPVTQLESRGHDQASLAQASQDRDVLAWLNSVGIPYQLHSGGIAGVVIVLTRPHEAVLRGVFDHSLPGQTFRLTPSHNSTVAVIRDNLAINRFPRISTPGQVRADLTMTMSTRSSTRAAAAAAAAAAEATGPQAPVASMAPRSSTRISGAAIASPARRNNSGPLQENRSDGMVSNSSVIGQQGSTTSHSSTARVPASQSTSQLSNAHPQGRYPPRTQSYTDRMNAAHLSPTRFRPIAPNPGQNNQSFHGGSASGTLLGNMNVGPSTRSPTQSRASTTGLITFNPTMNSLNELSARLNASVDHAGPSATSTLTHTRTTQPGGQNLLPAIQLQSQREDSDATLVDVENQDVQDLGSPNERNERGRPSAQTPESVTGGRGRGSRGRGRGRGRGRARGRASRSIGTPGRGRQNDREASLLEDEDTPTTSRRSAHAGNRRVRDAPSTSPMVALDITFGLPLFGAAPPGPEGNGFVGAEVAIQYDGPPLHHRSHRGQVLGPTYGTTYDNEIVHAPRGIFGVIYAVQRPGADLYRFSTEHRFDSPALAGNYLMLNLERIFWRTFNHCFRFDVTDPRTIMPPTQISMEFQALFYLHSAMRHDTLMVTGTVFLMEEVVDAASLAARPAQPVERQRAVLREQEGGASPATQQRTGAFERATAAIREASRADHQAAESSAGPSNRRQPTVGYLGNALSPPPRPQSPIRRRLAPDLPSQSQLPRVENAPVSEYLTRFGAMFPDTFTIQPQNFGANTGPLVTVPEPQAQLLFHTQFLNLPTYQQQQILFPQGLPPPQQQQITFPPAPPPPQPHQMPAHHTGFDFAPQTWPDWVVDDPDWDPYLMYPPGGFENQDEFDGHLLNMFPPLPGEPVEEYVENPFGVDHGYDPLLNAAVADGADNGTVHGVDTGTGTETDAAHAEVNVTGQIEGLHHGLPTGIIPNGIITNGVAYSDSDDETLVDFAVDR